MSGHSGHFQRGDHVVIDEAKAGAIVWLVEEEADKHGWIWLIRYVKRLTTEKRVHGSRLVLVETTDTIYRWPHTIWDPEQAKAEREALLARAHASQAN